MRLQAEERIVLVLLFMAMASLVVAYWAFDEGTTVVKGRVLDMRNTASGGHLLIYIDSSEMPIFVARDEGATQWKERLSPGARIEVAGRISSYAGGVEIRVERVSDIKLL